MGGGSETLGRARKSATEVAVQPELVSAPGKQTGVPTVDRGTACERDPGLEGCDPDMTENDRTRLLAALGVVVGSAMANYHAAIGKLRTELLTTAQSHSSWGFLAEVIFASLSHGIIGMLTKSVEAFKTRAAEVIFTEGGQLTVGAHGYDITRWAPTIAKMPTSLMVGPVVQASKGVRTLMKNAAYSNSTASREQVEAATFIDSLQADISGINNALVLNAPAEMTDAQIAALVAAYQDTTYHSIAAYEADLRDLVARFKAQQIPSIGDGRSNGPSTKMTQRETVWIMAHGKSRLAIVEFFDPIYAGAQGNQQKWYGDKIVPWKQTEFVTWIDDDLMTAALDYQIARVGGLQHIDATGGATGMPEVDAWAKGAP